MIDPQALQALQGQNVLITGATGFLGRHLTRALIGGGIRPVLMLRPGVRAPDGIKAVYATLEDHAALRGALAEAAPDVVFHLAAKVDRARDPALTQPMLAQNLHATLALAEAAAQRNVSRFIAMGTCEEYGHQPTPFAESLLPQPLSPYSASKAATTLWLKMMHKTQGFPAVILRPFLVYGPGQSQSMLVPSACMAALNGQDFPMTKGLQHRELTYVGDIVAGMIAAATKPEAIGEIINLGVGCEHRIIDLVKMIYKLAGGAGRPLPGALPDRPNDMQHFCADTTRAFELLEWQADTPLKTGLELTIEWMREHGDMQVSL